VNRPFRVYPLILRSPFIRIRTFGIGDWALALVSCLALSTPPALAGPIFYSGDSNVCGGIFATPNTAVPEPSSFALLLVGGSVAGLGLLGRYRCRLMRC
jgi:hypothetical protein